MEGFICGFCRRVFLLSECSCPDTAGVAGASSNTQSIISNRKTSSMAGPVKDKHGKIPGNVGNAGGALADTSSNSQVFCRSSSYVAILFLNIYMNLYDKNVGLSDIKNAVCCEYEYKSSQTFNSGLLPNSLNRKRKFSPGCHFRLHVLCEVAFPAPIHICLFALLKKLNPF